MRVHQGHQGQKSVIRDAQDAHFAIGLRDVLDQPVDGVVSVGGMVNRRGIARPAERAVHDVIALGAILAAHVLHDANVAAVDDDIGGVVVTLQNRPEVRALGMAGERLGIVRRARQQNRRQLGTLRNQDHGGQFYPIAHGDHDALTPVFKGTGGDGELRRNLRRDRIPRRELLRVEGGENEKRVHGSRVTYRARAPHSSAAGSYVPPVRSVFDPARWLQMPPTLAPRLGKTLRFLPLFQILFDLAPFPPNRM